MEHSQPDPIRPGDDVVLLADVVAHDSEGFSFILRPGDEGTCVAANDGGRVDVEFVDGNGDSLCVKTVRTSLLRRRV